MIQVALGWWIGGLEGKWEAAIHQSKSLRGELKVFAASRFGFSSRRPRRAEGSKKF